MTGTLITATSKISMQALAFQGIMAYSCFPQIRDMLMRRFGDEYVLLFARPSENLANGHIDWYSPVQGVARKLNSLPAEEQEPVCRKLAEMAREIHAYGEELIQSQDPLKVTRGNILKLALCYPDESALYVVGGQPVFTCWGFAPGTPGVEGKNLFRLVAAAPKRAAKAPVAENNHEPKKLGWLWWLLPLLPAILLFALLFGAIGPVPALSGITLFQLPELPFIKAKQDQSKDIADLETQIAELGIDLEKRAALCVPEKSGQPGAEQKLVIPEKARDASFLEGRWICDTGLASQRTGQAVEFEFSFDKNGKGKGIIYEKDDQCAGEAKAVLRDGVLHIDLAPQQCSKTGNSYGHVAIDCRNVLGQTAHCAGVNDDGTNWGANFRRY